MHRYQERRVIGRGNYGTARLVRDRRTGTKLVVKKIPLNSLSEKERRDAESECKLLAKLQHPNIVDYIDSFLEEESLHLVTQYCEQGDLAKLIKHYKKRGKYFLEKQIVDWFIQIAMAVDYIHSLNVMHRDLKTGNVFLTKTNVIKLGDFGIAKVLDSTLEQANTVVGTPYYMSPEVCENKQYNKKSDLWAMGCILYELCTLNHAFDASNLLGLVFKIVQESYPPIPDVYSPELRELVGQLLSKDPSRRPSCRRIFRMPFIRKRLEELATSASLGSAPAPAVAPATALPSSTSSLPSSVRTASASAGAAPAANSEVGGDDLETVMATLSLDHRSSGPNAPASNGGGAASELPPTSGPPVSRKLHRGGPRRGSGGVESANARNSTPAARRGRMRERSEDFDALRKHDRAVSDTANSARRTKSLQSFYATNVENEEPPNPHRIATPLSPSSSPGHSLSPGSSPLPSPSSNPSKSVFAVTAAVALPSEGGATSSGVPGGKDAAAKWTDSALGGEAALAPLTLEDAFATYDGAQASSDPAAMTPLDLAKERKQAAHRRREEELRAATLSNLESRRVAKRRSQEFFMPSAENYLAADFAETEDILQSGLASSGEGATSAASTSASAAGLEKESKAPDVFSSSEYDGLSDPPHASARKPRPSKDAPARSSGDWEATLPLPPSHGSSSLASQQRSASQHHANQASQQRARARQGSRPSTGGGKRADTPGGLGGSASTNRRRRTYQHVNHHHYLRPRTSSMSSGGGSDSEGPRRRSLPQPRIESFDGEPIVPYNVMDERPIKSSGRYDVDEWTAQHRQRGRRPPASAPSPRSRTSQLGLAQQLEQQQQQQQQQQPAPPSDQQDQHALASAADSDGEISSDSIEDGEFSAVAATAQSRPDQEHLPEKVDDKDARRVLAECKRHAEHRDAWTASSSSLAASSGTSFARRTSNGSAMSSSSKTHGEKRTGPDWSAIAGKQRKRLVAALGPPLFDHVYAFLKKGHEAGATTVLSSAEKQRRLGQLVGKDKLKYCFDVDQLLYIEETYF